MGCCEAWPLSALWLLVKCSLECSGGAAAAAAVVVVGVEFGLVGCHWLRAVTTPIVCSGGDGCWRWWVCE
jgi:hypothetical protein